jgi:hypothetical protein
MVLIMSNEEIEKRMAFIVEQQAQFASDIQLLQESQSRTDQVIVRTAEVVERLADVTTRLAHVTLEGFNDVNAKINVLVDSQIHTDENVARTDESLRNLIVVVDRYFRGRGNGNGNEH